MASDRTRTRIPATLRTFAAAVRRLGEWIPLTARGAAVVVLSTFALLPFGFGSLDLVLFVVGWVGVLLVGLTLLLVVASALWLRRRSNRETKVADGDSVGAGLGAVRVEAGSRVATGFSFSSLASVPLIEVGWHWLAPEQVSVLPRVRGQRLSEEIVAHRRCAVETVARRFEVSDVLGLARVRWRRDQRVPVVVLPALGRLRATSVVRALASADGIAHPSGMPEGDRMEIRRYVPGDSVRHILWKTFARTRELTVRVPERSVERARKTVAYLVTAAGDEPAAAAARMALEGGALGEDWLFGTDGMALPTADLATARMAIARSGALRAQGAGLASFLDHVAPMGGDVHCVVFAPAREGAWTQTVLAEAGRRRGMLSFVLATDGVVRPTPRSLWRRMLFGAVAQGGTPAAALGSLVRTLSSTGAAVQAVDRATGKVFGDRHHERLPGGARAGAVEVAA
jgi:hypothetical protein